MSSLFEELKRRNVFRVAFAYLISGWLVLQIADLVLDGIDAPAWVMKALLLFGALGFPFVLVFSWAYELTPDGVKRERDIDRDQSITRETGRKLNLVTIGMLVTVLAVVVVERVYFHDRHGEVQTPVVAAEDRSIAVLAFEDLSPEGDQAYFAQGLSEELLNVLAQVGDLQVAGRTSSFAFKGEKKDLREIGELLNVAHILEGSVRKAGNRIRVTAQLINTSDGFHLFSQTYDRELSDVFAVQDEIAQSISTALLSEIVGAETITATRTNPEAYELYLLARQRIHTRDILAMREASNMLTRALEIDPLYAPALAQKALVTHLMSDSIGAYGDIPIAEAMPMARQLVDQALALDKNLAEAHAIKGLLLDDINQREEAIPYLEQALELNPTMSDAANWLSSTLSGLGRVDDARGILEKIVERDPTYGPAFNNLTMEYTRTGDFDQANGLVDRVAGIVGENDGVHQSRGTIAFMRGEPAEAIRELRPAIAENPNATIVQFWYGLALLGVADYETLVEAGLPEHQMFGYAGQGLMEAALKTMEDMDLDAAFRPRVLGEIGVVLNDDNLSQRYLDYLLERYGSLDDLLREEPVDELWGIGYLPQVAYAYLIAGDEETFENMRKEMHEALDSDRARGMDNLFVQFDEAQYFALSGDIEATLSATEKALDSGYSTANALDWGIFSGLHGEPRFEALRTRLAEHVDAERAKLGMPPYRPIAPTDDKRPDYVH